MISEFKAHFEPKILIVDDDLTDILLMQKSLAGLGDIYNAASGRQAIEQLDLLRPEIVLLDIEMPDVNGLEICQTIKDNPALKSTRVIFVTAHEDDHTEYLSFKTGADDYLVKPYNLNICRFRVQNQIRMIEMFRQNQQFLSLLNALPLNLSVWTEAETCLFANTICVKSFEQKESFFNAVTLSGLIGPAVAKEFWQQAKLDVPTRISLAGDDESITHFDVEVQLSQLIDNETVLILTIHSMQ